MDFFGFFQGEDDKFLKDQLLPHKFEEACRNLNVPLLLRFQPGYDHSYYFIATFIDDHIRHHAQALKLSSLWRCLIALSVSYLQWTSCLRVILLYYMHLQGPFFWYYLARYVCYCTLSFSVKNVILPSNKSWFCCSYYFKESKYLLATKWNNTNSKTQLTN